MDIRGIFALKRENNNINLNVVDIGRLLERYDTISLNRVLDITDNTKSNILSLLLPYKRLNLITIYKKRVSPKYNPIYRIFIKKNYDDIVNKYTAKMEELNKKRGL